MDRVRFFFLHTVCEFYIWHRVCGFHMGYVDFDMVYVDVDFTYGMWISHMGCGFHIWDVDFAYVDFTYGMWISHLRLTHIDVLTIAGRGNWRCRLCHWRGMHHSS